jgi:histidinol-phosphate aminotransferase
MHLSRRNFLRSVGLGTAAATAVQLPFSGLASAAVFEPSRTKGPGGSILLDSNENVYGPSAKTAAAIRAALSSVNRYPFREYDGLVERIASLHHVKPEQVMLGCGSTEILRLAAAAFLGPGKQLIQASPTFEAMDHYARSTGAEVISLPLTATFAHDLDAMLGRTGPSSTLVYICNPNNPTASLTPRTDIETFIGRLPANAYVLIDEAYHHYAGTSAMYASFLDRPLESDRVIVCRTFSKVYGLAGLRLGYGIAAPGTAKRMNSYVTADNVNGVVVRAAMAALDDTATVADFAKRNEDARQEFFNQAMARMLKPIDSHANFVMMNTHHPAEQVIEHFRKNDVLIGRRFPAMDSYIRVSLGTSQDMMAFWRVWDMLPFAKAAMQH